MLDRTAKLWLRDHFGPAIRFDEPMSRHTRFGIGGPADALVEPPDEKRLRQLIQWAQARHIPYLILGGGTNVLVRDGGIRGLVIRLKRMASKIDWVVNGATVCIKAGAAAPTRRMCALALRHGWQGMNFALGIPGSLGGALMMNAGTAWGSLGDVVAKLTVITAGAEQLSIAGSDIVRGYRCLTLPAHAGPSAILLEVELALNMGDRDQIRADAEHIIRARVNHQPIQLACAGCYFKNPSPQLTAGRLIDEAGFKGSTVGQAQVSPLHANFIVNLGQATAAEVLELVEKIQTAVWQRYRIGLEPEVQVVGETASA